MKLLAALPSLALLALVSAANAEPAAPLSDRPISLVVPFSAGGGSDLLARVIAKKLEDSIRRTVLVDNKPGANGLLASQFVERSRPDGHTLMLGSTSTHVIAPLLSPDQRAIESIRSNFAMISVVANTPLVLAVLDSSEFKDLNQFLSATRAGGLTYGTFGAGSSPHLMGTLLAVKRNVNLLHVPYKGSAPAVTDLLGRNIDSVFLTVAAISAYVEAKQFRALAVTGEERVVTLPDVPTFKELGITDLENAGWFGVLSPAKTPDDVISYLHGKVREVMALPDMRAKLVELGLQKREGSLAEDRKLWDLSIATTQAILRQSKIDINGK